MNTIHGGAIATWIDNITGLAIYGFDKQKRLQHVSINLTCDYIQASYINENIIFKANVYKVGENIAFTDCQIYNGDGSKLIASGTHKKSFVNI